MIGLVTSVFFFVSRDVYGTIAFHNFLGILGVIRALEVSGNISAFEHPIVALWIMAVVAVALQDLLALESPLCGHTAYGVDGVLTEPP